MRSGRFGVLVIGLFVSAVGVAVEEVDLAYADDLLIHYMSARLGDSPERQYYDTDRWAAVEAMGRAPSYGVPIHYMGARLGYSPAQQYYATDGAAAEQKRTWSEAPYCDPCGKSGGRCLGCCHNDVWARWTVSAGGLYMKRQSPDSVVLFSNPLNPAEAINAADFDFDFRSGFELDLTRHRLLWGIDLEARFFMIDGWSDTVTASTTGPVTRIHTELPIDLPGGRDITSSYSSELTSFELNLRKRVRRMPRVRWLAGLRYLELNEHLFTSCVSPTVPAWNCSYEVATQNRLLGFQLGGDLDIYNRNRFCLRGYGKVGVYGNAADNNSRVGCSGPPPVDFFAGQSRGHTAFIGELGLSAKYCCTKRFALRADYRAMWIDGVALASNQLEATSFFTFSGIDTTGGLLYHGLFLGATWSF